MLSSVGQCHNRVVESLPFVQQLARRMAASMPHSIDVGDLVQDGVIGLIDASRRFDEARGIKFQTFAERRIRGAMIDALRKDAWPRGVRRQRRELEEARQAASVLGYNHRSGDWYKKSYKVFNKQYKSKKNLGKKEMGLIRKKIKGLFE